MIHADSSQFIKAVNRRFPVVIRSFPVSSRFDSVLNTCPVESPVVLNNLNQPGWLAGLLWFVQVSPGSPPMSTAPLRFSPGSPWFFPVVHTLMSWGVKPGQ